jgi:hypothetical protein
VIPSVKLIYLSFDIWLFQGSGLWHSTTGAQHVPALNGGSQYIGTASLHPAAIAINKGEEIERQNHLFLALGNRLLSPVLLTQY